MSVGGAGLGAHDDWLEFKTQRQAANALPARVAFRRMSPRSPKSKWRPLRKSAPAWQLMTGTQGVARASRQDWQDEFFSPEAFFLVGAARVPVAKLQSRSLQSRRFGAAPCQVRCMCSSRRRQDMAHDRTSCKVASKGCKPMLMALVSASTAASEAGAYWRQDVAHNHASCKQRL